MSQCASTVHAHEASDLLAVSQPATTFVSGPGMYVAGRGVEIFRLEKRVWCTVLRTEYSICTVLDALTLPIARTAVRCQRIHRPSGGRYMVYLFMRQRLFVTSPNQDSSEGTPGQLLIKQESRSCAPSAFSTVGLDWPTPLLQFSCALLSSSMYLYMYSVHVHVPSKS